MTDSLNHFLAENERQAFRMAQLATGHKDEALDIVQDAMIKLVQKYGQRPSDEWGPLFHRIMQRQITDWYRKTVLTKNIFSWFVSNDEQEDNHCYSMKNPEAHTPEKQLQTEQAINALQSALQDLPLRQRQVFLLRCWQGLNTAETAHAMTCSTGSVKTHYHRALKKLRTKLGDTWP